MMRKTNCNIKKASPTPVLGIPQQSSDRLEEQHATSEARQEHDHVHLARGVYLLAGTKRTLKEAPTGRFN